MGTLPVIVLVVVVVAALVVVVLLEVNENGFTDPNETDGGTVFSELFNEFVVVVAVVDRLGTDAETGTSGLKPEKPVKPVNAGLLLLLLLLSFVELVGIVGKGLSDANG